jgi:hypothetical protein
VPGAEALRHASPARRPLAVALLLGVGLFALYRATERSLDVVVDVRAVALLPVSLWRDGDLALDEFADRRDLAEVLELRGGHWISSFPPWPAIQLFPAYAVWGLVQGGFPGEAEAAVAQRRAAQMWMAATAVLVGLTVAREMSRRAALWVTAGFAVGSINWFVLSQLAFSNGLAEFWLALALWLSYRERPPTRLEAGLSLAALVVATFLRLHLALVLVAWAGLLAVRMRRRVALPLVGAVAFGGLLAAGNWLYSGHLLGFYGEVAGATDLPSPTLAEALYGNLLGPSRGVLVFSPWLLLAGWGLRAGGPLDAQNRLLLLASGLHLLVVSNFWHWVGGESLGPRLTADVLPLLAVAAAPGVEALLERGRRAVLVVLVGASVIVAAGHAFWNPTGEGESPVRGRLCLDCATDWRDPFVLQPFRATPYEERYEIRLVAPALRARVREPPVLAWKPWASASRYEVELATTVRTQQRTEVRRVRLPAGAATQLVLPPGALPEGEPTVAWRVRGVGEDGECVGRSGWRVFLRPPRRTRIPAGPVLAEPRPG